MFYFTVSFDDGRAVDVMAKTASAAKRYAKEVRGRACAARIVSVRKGGRA